MPTPAVGTTITFTNVTTEFGLSINPPSRAIGADFRFAGGTYTPASPVIPTGAGTTISLSGDLGGRTKVSAGNSGLPTWIATTNFGQGQQGFVCCLDSSENIYVGGGLTITTATAYNAGTTTGTNSTYVATTLGGIGLAKYNSSGIVQWVTEIDGAGNDQFGFVTFTNNLYVGGRAGTTWPTAWNAGSSTVGQTMSTGAVSATIGYYIAKYNSSGIAQYMIGYGCSNGTGVFASTIETDSSENIYCVGRVGGPGQSAWAFGPGGGTNINYPTPGTSTGISCIVIKWNASGTPLWMAMMRTSGNGYGTGVAWNNAASQLGVTANAGGAVQAIAYNANQNPTTTGITCSVSSQAGTTTTAVAAYNTSGTALWCTVIFNTLTTDIKSCGYLTSDSSGNWYVCGTSGSGVAPIAYSAGTSSGTVAAITPLLSGAFLVKFNSSGAVQWIAMVDSTSSVNNYGMSVQVDQSNNIYFTTFCNTANRTVDAYNAGSSTIALTSRVPNACPWTVWKYNSSGIVQNVIVGYNGANYNNFLGNNKTLNGKLYSTFTGNAGAIRWTVYGADNATNITSANTGTGALVKFN